MPGPRPSGDYEVRHGSINDVYNLPQETARSPIPSLSGSSSTHISEVERELRKAQDANRRRLPQRPSQHPVRGEREPLPRDRPAPESARTEAAPPKEEMSKPVLFYGKPNQLEDVLTFVRVQFLVQGTSESQKAPVLAQLFRGSALNWLTNELKVNPSLLDDYDEFVSTVESGFGLSEAAATAQAARKYANSRQRASVQLYAIEFKQLSTQLGIPDATAVAQFVKGLKSHVREALIINDETGNLDEIISEATRIDSQMYSSKRGFTSFKSPGRGTSHGTSGKCHTCGQFGHKARDCKVKSEKAPWS